MSRKLMLACFVIATLCAPAMVEAQEEESEPNLIYGTYYYCSPLSKQDVADEIVEYAFAPIYDAAVDDGSINSWAWLAHHTGGKWRRLMVFTATGIDKLLQAQEILGERMEEVESAAPRVFGEICDTHDDYIWEAAEGGGSLTEGEAHFSIYYYCASDKEERADEIVGEVFVPILNQHLETGDITSWGWNKHFVGGKLRRILTLTAADQASVVKARGAIIDDLYSGDSEAGANEFDGICGAHEDYMWELQQFKGILR